MHTPQELAKSLQNNALFDDVLNGVDPRTKHSSITQDVNQLDNLASIRQTESFFKDYLFPAWLSYTNGQLQTPRMYAVSIANLTTTEIPFDQLKNDGFSIDEPITSHLEFQKGSDPEGDENRVGEEQIHLTAGMIRQFSTNPTAVLDQLKSLWGIK